ncbi:purple acid phosphatase family protein [Urbifossiella limnaea]|uniref:Calcineurin-like phosphoesterase n=1 Tax=Urbifossiella limnaea TaxID=2528023 RepID=A0A517XMA8_9BACT|nr:metallophosphoesterase family protein [Urbifossiella limnaea]QDU18648.1 Calcineurin-like phosphoesterase [Urbifossiella limnaea]
MHPLDRRGFLGASLAALAAAPAATAAAERLPVAPPPREVPMPGIDSLFLTYAQDPTRTVVVQWVGYPGVAPTVRHGRLTAFSWDGATPTATRPFGDSPWVVYRAELTGLVPGTEYLFRVDGHPRTYRFRTMPAKATDTFTFVSGGDCGVNAHAVANNILAAKQEPHFALIAGDLGYDNGTSARTALGFLKNYGQHMVDPQGRLIPLVTCLGNHEVKGGYARSRAAATYYFPLFDGLYPETSYAALDFGDYLSLVLLDTGHVSPVGGAQADWLGGALAARQDRPHLIVANHVPAYPSYRAPTGTGVMGLSGTGDGNRRYWCPLFERHNVDVVLEHHDHTFKRTHPLKDGRPDKNGVLYLGDGSWGMLRPPVSPEKRPYLASVGRAYHVSLHRLEGDRRFHVALDESGKVADVTATFGKRPARRG